MSVDAGDDRGREGAAQELALDGDVHDAGAFAQDTGEGAEDERDGEGHGPGDEAGQRDARGPGAADHPDQEGDHEDDGEHDRQPARGCRSLRFQDHGVAGEAEQDHGEHDAGRGRRAPRSRAAGRSRRRRTRRTWRSFGGPCRPKKMNATTASTISVTGSFQVTGLADTPARVPLPAPACPAGHPVRALLLLCSCCTSGGCCLLGLAGGCGLLLARVQSEDRPDQRRRRDEQHDERLDHQHDVDRGAGLDLHLDRTGAEGAEQDAGGERAPRRRTSQQCDGDGVEAVAWPRRRRSGPFRCPPPARRRPGRPGRRPGSSPGWWRGER